MRHGPAQASSTSIWMPILGQHYSSRGSRIFIHQVWAATRRTICPRTSFVFTFITKHLRYDLLCREGAATESHTTNGCHRERLKPLDSRVEDPDKSEGVLALDDTHILFSSPEALIVLGLDSRSATRMRGKSIPQALRHTNEGERYQSQMLHQPCRRSYWHQTRRRGWESYRH